MGSEVICELCARVCEVDADTAEVAGWIQTWDGWICPAHLPTPERKP